MYLLKKKPILNCFIIFAICLIARILEYFVIRTDKIDSSVLITKYSIILAIKHIAKIIKQFNIGFFFNEYITLSYSFFI